MTKREIFEEFFSLKDITSQCIRKYPGEINGNDFAINNVIGCEIYLLDVTDRVLVDSASSCKIIIGPSKNSVLLRNCSSCIIAVACKELRIENCSDLSIQSYVDKSITVEKCSSLKFMKFSVGYSGLTSHFKEAQLSIQKSHCFDIKDIGEIDGDKSKCYELVEVGEEEAEVVEIPNAKGKAENPVSDFEVFIEGNKDPKSAVCVDKSMLSPKLVEYLYPESEEKEREKEGEESSVSAEVSVEKEEEKEKTFEVEYVKWREERLSKKKQEMEEKLKNMKALANEQLKEFYSERSERISSLKNNNRKTQLSQQNNKDKDKDTEDDKLIWSRVMEVLKSSESFSKEYQLKKKMIDLITEKAT